MKASAFLAASLDGFIARENGDLDWLPGGGSDGGEDYGYKKFIETVDALVMGRHSYEKALTFGDWPYTKPVVVLSRRTLDIPRRLGGAVLLGRGIPLFGPLARDINLRHVETQPFPDGLVQSTYEIVSRES